MIESDSRGSKPAIIAAATIPLKGTNIQHTGHMGQNFQTELMVEIYFKSLGRAIGITHEYYS